jgi:hypothetical protein
LIGLLVACSPEEYNSAARAATPLATRQEQLLADAPADGNSSVGYANRRPPGSTAGGTDDEAETMKSPMRTPLPDPIEMLTSIAQDQRKTCDKFTDHETFSGLENGYPTSVRLFVCTVNRLITRVMTLVRPSRVIRTFM